MIHRRASVLVFGPLISVTGDYIACKRRSTLGVATAAGAWPRLGTPFEREARAPKTGVPSVRELLIDAKLLT